MESYSRPRAFRTLRSFRIHLFDIYLGAANRVVDRLRAFANIFADDHFFNDARLLAHHRLFRHLGNFDHAFLECAHIGIAHRTIHRAALNVYMLFTLTHLRFHRPLRNVAINAHTVPVVGDGKTISGHETILIPA